MQAEPPASVDVAIVGAGISGLMAGASLAVAGLRVALFDPHYVAGGCATQFARGGKRHRYCFDVGLHYIGDCGDDGQIPRLLRSVGIDQRFVPMDPDGFDVFVFPDFRFRVPADIERYRQRLLDMFPAERRGIDRWVRLVGEVGHIAGQVMKHHGRLSLGMLAQVLLHGRLAGRYVNATMESFLDDTTRDPRLRAVILGQHGDYALPPSKASAMLHAGLAGHYFAGAYYPEGGGQIMSDRLAAVIEARGGSIHLRRGVERILVERGRAVGVVTEPRARGDDRWVVRARAVLSSADITRTLLELVGPEALPRRWRRRVARFEMAGALFMTFLGVEGDVRDLGMGASNYWAFDSYDTEAVYRDMYARPDIAPAGAYITSATLKDPQTRHAPAGISNVEVMALIDASPHKWGVRPDDVAPWRYKRDGRYLDIKRRVERALIARFDAVFPGAASRIVYQESATPMTHTRYTRARDGSGYGLACTPALFLQGRPGYQGPLPGLFLCGASTRAGHGIVGAMTGGAQAARMVAAALGAGVASRSRAA